MISYVPAHNNRNLSFQERGREGLPIDVLERKKVSSFLVFFLIHTMQVGVGILGFTQILVQKAGADAWIAVVLAGAAIHGVIVVMYRLLQSPGDDIIAVHHRLFGKWCGGILSVIVIIYVAYGSVAILSTYVNVVQVWVFPHLSSWTFAAVYLILAICFVFGGLRTVAGICFLSLVYGLPLILTLYPPLQYGEYSNFLPMMTAKPSDLFAATKEAMFSFAGIQLLLFYFPFIKRAEASQRWAHYGNALTIAIYLVVTVVSILYYSKGQIAGLLWPTLTFWKIISLPFLERFEYIGIMIWIFVIMPNICLGLWCASRGLKRLFSMQQRHAVWVVAFIVYLTVGMMEDVVEVRTLNTILGRLDLVFLFIYLPTLAIVQNVLKKIKK